MNRMAISLSIVALIAAAITVGCSKDHPATRDAAAAQTPVVPDRVFAATTIPSGTIITASLDARVSTTSSQTGEAFTATTIEPVMVNGRVAIPTGARIHGVLRDVKAAGRIKGRAHLTLAYDSIVDAEGTTESMNAFPLTLQAPSGTRGDVEKIAGGGILGAIVGGIAGGGKGAAIGAGAGAGAGTVLTLAHKGDDVSLEAGQRLNVRTSSSTTVQVLVP